MSAHQLLVEEDGSVLRVTLNRPEKRNALSRSLLGQIGAAFDAHAANQDLRLAVLRGAGDKSFAAGGDLKDLSALRSLDQAAGMAEQAKAALDAIRRFPVPVVAAINGDALGGGSELALACDFRVLAAHARIGFLQGRINISTAWGGGIDVLRAVGRTRGLGLLCTGEMVGGARALEIGLADAVAAAGETLDAALDTFIAPFERQAPQVLRAFKALANATSEGQPRAALDALETRLFAANWVHRDHWEAVDRLLGA